jgi:2-polyprenyl-3-methyl-5-hydroxy-6-metoxy-1,4-benzoquinol methylase
VSENAVTDYGWHSVQAPKCCDYVGPRVLRELRRLKIKRILDLGAGNGALCGQMHAHGYEVVGVEYDKSGVELARCSQPQIMFYNFGVQDNPSELLKSELPFDAVVSTEVVEHLFSPHLLPMYAQSVLKRGGFLIVTTPYHGYFKNLALSIFGKWDRHHTALWHGGHIKFWSRKTLEKLLTDNGFNVLSFSGVGRFPFLWKSMVLIAQKV